MMAKESMLWVFWLFLGFVRAQAAAVILLSAGSPHLAGGAQGKAGAVGLLLLLPGT